MLFSFDINEARIHLKNVARRAGPVDAIRRPLKVNDRVLHGMALGESSLCADLRRLALVG
jgi:hypothetical protein